MSGSCPPIRILLPGAMVLLAILPGCAGNPSSGNNPDVHRPSKRNSTAAAEMMRDAQQDNALYRSQGKLDRQTKTAAAKGSGQAVFKGHITAVRLSASGAPLVHVSGSASPWLHRRQTAMVHVFRGDKPMGVYPMKVIRQGELTILDPLGATIELRQGDSISIAPPGGGAQ